ncbi:hypothetical protein M91_14369, partial [Bos mutus]
MATGNHSSIKEFILLGLSADTHIQALLFVLFLMIYLLTLLGNLLIILVTHTDSTLHTPMYFFLSHLSFQDLFYSSVTVPKMLENLLSQRKVISVEGCMAQVFFVFATTGIEACLLSVMAYDRYAAICHPLLYRQVMRKQLCVKLVWGSWVVAFLDALINILLALDLDFCEVQTIHHYSCELPSLFPLSCSDISTNAAMLLSNHSTITEFILLGLSADPKVQILLFVLFMGIYLLTMMGNLILLLVIRADSHLHTPMYFFLSHLSFLDLCFSSVTVPKLLENLLSKEKIISKEGCLTQAFFVFDIGGTEVFLL